MNTHPYRSLLRALATVAAFAALLRAPSASALQPLREFLVAAPTHNPDTLEARAALAQQSADAMAALGRVLPGLSARGTYTRNQYETRVTLPSPGGPAETVTLTPSDQWFGAATLTVPLVDLAGFRRVAASRTAESGAERQVAAAGLQVQAQVVQSYYQLVANLALVAASRDALEVSREALRLAQERLAAGTAPALEVDRARADVEQQFQQVAAAELQVALAGRALESASGLAPDVSQVVQISDDLHPEADLAAFEGTLDHVPSVAAARLGTRAAEQEGFVQRLALLPSLAASFTEYGTNASGFAGHEAYGQGVLALTWSFDLTSVANVRRQDAAADAARARELRTRLAAKDAIHRQWRTIAAGIARSRSARAGREAAAHAAELARTRYGVGASTQLDLLQANRDAFGAEVARIQADADLVNARAQLRLAAGRDLVAHQERNETP